MLNVVIQNPFKKKMALHHFITEDFSINNFG